MMASGCCGSSTFKKAKVDSRRGEHGTNDSSHSSSISGTAADQMIYQNHNGVSSSSAGNHLSSKSKRHLDNHLIDAPDGFTSSQPHPTQNNHHHAMNRRPQSPKPRYNNGYLASGAPNRAMTRSQHHSNQQQQNARHLQSNGIEHESSDAASSAHMEDASGQLVAVNSHQQQLLPSNHHHHQLYPAPPLPLSNAVSASSASGERSIVHPDMCFYCFDVLYSYLHDMETPDPPQTIPAHDAFPLFVTWKAGKHPRLRGCIGTFNSLNLHHGLREYAISSAMHDSRFQPIQQSELDKLICSVSILHQFEGANDHLDWHIGMHGIRIEFVNDKGSKKTATYLPEVAPEQGWDHVQTIDSLLRKAGHKGAITHDRRRAIRITRYRSQKVTVTHADYVGNKRTLHELARINAAHTLG